MNYMSEVLENDHDLRKLFPGFFMEGVFISPEKGWRGAHQPRFIKQPDFELFRKLRNAARGRIKIVNVAPEEPGGLEFISRAVKSGSKVSIGHCNPSAEIVEQAVKAGATLITHFGNGAAPQIHRFDNPFWPMLNAEELAPALIADGHHLPKDLIGCVLKCKKPGHCFIVSDANFNSGLPPGIYQRSDGGIIEIGNDGKIHLQGDENTLAGAWFQLDRGVDFLVNNCGVPFCEAWKLASVYPARLAGIDLPSLRIGEDASFLLVKRTSDKLHIINNIHSGKDYIN